MRRQVRKGVFETNSSSMHSLTVMKRDDTYAPDEFLKGIYLRDDRETGEEDCVWEPWENDMYFGRSPFRVLRTFSDKWLYACASLVKEYNDETYKELAAIALKYVPGLKKIKMPLTSGAFINRGADNRKDDEYSQKYGKTEDELVEYLTQMQELWRMEVEYWETSQGWWHYDRPCTGYVDEDILSGFLCDEEISVEEFLIFS